MWVSQVDPVVWKIAAAVMSAPGTIWNTWQIWSKARAKPDESRRKYPKLFWVFSVLMVVGFGLGLWFALRPKVSHPPVAQQAAAGLLPNTAPKPEQQQQQATPPPKPRPRTHRKQVQPAPTIAQSGTDNNQTVTGTVRQSTSGTNSPNVVGNNNQITYGASPNGPSNAQFAASARNIALRFRDLQAKLNWDWANERNEHKDMKFPVGFYTFESMQLQPLRTEGLVLRQQILSRLPAQPLNYDVEGVLDENSLAGAYPLNHVADYFDGLAAQLDAK
jgi:hypothetical protein